MVDEIDLCNAMSLFREDLNSLVMRENRLDTDKRFMVYLSIINYFIRTNSKTNTEVRTKVLEDLEKMMEVSITLHLVIVKIRT